MDEWDVVVRTIAALAAGGAIGLERSYHGRAAGLRTYALVSFGSALLVAGSQHAIDAGVYDVNVTRVIQGLVTGIGFLGAGVIVKEGFSVRGLTTAASIWVSAAIGVVFAAGSYAVGVAASVVTLAALTLLRRLEDRLPAQTFVHFEVGFRRDGSVQEARLRELVAQHGFTVTDLSYRLERSSQILECRMVMFATRADAVRTLEQSLLGLPDVVEFRLSPSRD